MEVRGAHIWTGLTEMLFVGILEHTSLKCKSCFELWVNKHGIGNM